MRARSDFCREDCMQRVAIARRLGTDVCCTGVELTAVGWHDMLSAVDHWDVGESCCWVSVMSFRTLCG